MNKLIFATHNSNKVKEVRELLSKYEFDGDNIPIVKGSALAAVEGGDEEKGGRGTCEVCSCHHSLEETR